MASTTTGNFGKNSGVLLLGASGQLGRMLRHFWRAPPDLVAHSRQPKPDFIPFDLIVEPEKATAAMAGKRAVICLSGVTNARAAATQDVYSRNTDLAVAAVRCAALAKVPRVFLASSAAVYGANPGVQDETTVPQPVAAYGKSKLEMEQAALACAQKLGQNVTALRIGNVAGADAILGGWREGMEIDQLKTDGTPRRSYIGPQTLTRVLAQLSEIENLPEVLNIAAPGVIEMGALLDAAGRVWTPRTAPDSVIEEVALSTKQLERYVSFAPEDSTAAGMVAEWRLLDARG
jgi:nucleoside-diphosphate-sugar epimerase